MIDGAVPLKDGTEEAFSDPQPGDVFQEMYSFWVVVVYVDSDHVVVMEGIPPCTMPQDGHLRGFETHDDYRKHYSYKSIDGYVVRLSKRNENVTGWFDPTRGPTS